MKRLKPELSTNPRYVSALQKEFDTGSHLDHPHLVHYVSKGEDYLLTEYVDGQTLDAFVEDNPDYFKSVQNANHFLKQLLDVVGYLHQHQVVHLDLKPGNILITRIGHEVKLTDLGFCYTDAYTDTMGRTDKYAAPEQINGSQVNATTDIYAIGKIMDSLSLPSIYNKVKAKCLQSAPSARFQTTTDVINHLPKEKSFNRWWLLLFIIAITIGVLFYPKTEQNHGPIPVIQPRQISEQVDDVHPQKYNTKTPPTHSSITKEQLPNQETSFRELTDSERKEIRNITLSFVQPVYQLEIEPIVDRVIRGDYDRKQYYITDSLDKAFVLANEKVFAGLRKNNLKSKYSDAIEDDVNNEILYAIGDAMFYYSQRVSHYFNSELELPINPFAK